MDHHTTTTTAVDKKKRNRIQGTPPQWDVVRDMLHMRLKDAAAELNVPETYIRRLCKKNGYETWPGKRIRYMNSTGRMLAMLQVDVPKGSPPLGGVAAGPSKPETKEKEKELVTLNLIDKVGCSSSSKPNN